MDSFEDVDDRWEYWKSMFRKIVDTHIPMKKARVRAQSLPWIGRSVRKLMRARNYYCTKAKKSRNQDDWKQYRKLRNLVTWELKKAKTQFFERMSDHSFRNPRKMWKELNRVLGRGDKQKIDAVKTPDGRITGRRNIVEELNKYFSLWSGVPGIDGVATDQWALPSLDCDFKFEKVEEEEVLKLLGNLDVNKAIGLDGISGKLLRMTAPAISRSLASLFNFSLKTGQVPSEWKLSRVTPVPKGGNSEEVGNFRPVSVLPVVAKVLERIVHHQLYAYLQRFSILHVAQSGTQNVLVSTLDDWRQAVDEDKLVGSIMVDLSKAFDTISHPILHRKLASYGVRNDELKWFKSYLDGRRQRVCIGAVQSAWSDIRRGVPQGSILGPLLFTIYVNDLPQAVVQSKVRQYADDTTMYCASDSSAALSGGLSADLARVADWVEQNGLKLNEAKTQMLLLSRRRRAKELEDVVVTLRGQEVTRSDKVKYLGVWIDEGLTWSDHIEVVRKKCFGGLAKLRRLRDSLPEATKKNIYNALILPYLDYCCVVWQECSKTLQRSIERIQNYGMRLICSKPPRTPSEELRSRMNWMPLTNRREMFRLTLVHRAVHNQAPTYMTELFRTNESYGCRVTRGFKKLHMKMVTTEFGRKAASFMGAQGWNKLAGSIRNIENIHTFRSRLKNLFLNS